MYHVLTCFIEQKKGVIQYVTKIPEKVFLYYFQVLIFFYLVIQILPVLFELILPYHYLPIFEKNYEATIYINHYNVFSTSQNRSNGIL